MCPCQVGVQVDHLRLHPEAEFHAQFGHPVHQWMQPVRPDVRVDLPVAEAGVVVAAADEPAVVQHVPLGADLGAVLGQGDQSVQVHVEVHRFPGVQDDRPRGARVGGPCAQECVEPACDLVEPGAVGAVDPRAGVGTACGERDLARQ